MPAPSHQIPIDAPSKVKETLVGLGRTEDVKFSPSGQRLAIACFDKNTIVLVDVEMSAGSERPSIALTSTEEIAAPDLRHPHGLTFADDDTLVVANREGGVTVIDLADPARRSTTTESVHDDRTSLLHWPGSVVARTTGGQRVVLVCNNYANRVSRHVLAADGRLVEGENVARRFVEVPDGLAWSTDGRWLAVSNHSTHVVFVYEYDRLGEDAEPVAFFRGVQYPHGMCFAGDDRFLLVADAGQPHVQVFAAGSDGWAEAAYPIATLRLLDDSTFADGKTCPVDGGPKGVDVDRESRVLVTTTLSLPLAFFDLRAMLRDPRPDVAALYEYERHVAEMRTFRIAIREALIRSRFWGATKPLRTVTGTARSLRQRLATGEGARSPSGPD